MLQSKLKTIFLSVSVTVLAASLITFPQESFEASLRGLNMWWKIVFPSLLPFFIVSEMLIGFGVVRFLGVILEPLMRPVFRVPGVGGFVIAMGMASGFPAGAKLTARLRQEGHLSQIEAERLVSFTNSSNPIFIFGAVSVGFFNNPHIGIILALSHYLGNICVGILMRFYGKGETGKSTEGKKFHLSNAFAILHQTRLRDNRPIGKLLGDAVTSSIQTLLMIGGFIIIFSVLNKMLYLLHITAFLAKAVELFLSILSFPVSLSIPLISGLFEITLGSQLTSNTGAATLLQQVIITSFILGFSGLSVQAQVASILAQTDIRFKPFFFARIIHGVLAGVFAFLLWEPLSGKLKTTFLKGIHIAVPVSYSGEWSWIDNLYNEILHTGPLITIFALCIYVLILTVQTKR